MSDLRRRNEFADGVAVLLIPLAALLAFTPVMSALFTSWDDYETVARNPLLVPWAGRDALAAFWSRPHGHLYIPVTYTAWYAGAVVAHRHPLMGTPQLDPRVFHLMNLGLHAFAGVLVYAVLKQLVSNRYAALVGAMLFTLHPVQVESVGWVSGLKDVLFGTLSLGAVYHYLKFRSALQASWSRLHFVTATVLFVLAMLAKPTAMVLPFVVIALDALVLRRTLKDALRATWPWLTLAVPCALAARTFQPPVHTADASPLWARVPVALDAIGFYVGKVVWPATLTIDYGRTPAYIIATGQIAWTWLVPAAAVGLAVFAWRRGVREVAAGLAVLVIIVLPVLGLVPFDFQTYSTVADHYLYLAMLGPALIVATLVARRPTGAVFVAAAVVISVLGVRTLAQARHWHDSSSLFAHAIDANPKSWVAYNSLAALALEKDDPERAKSLADQSIAIRPTALAYTTLGEAQRRKGDPVAAAEAYQQALARDGAFAPALANFAVMRAEQGRLDEAIDLARRATAAAPDVASYRVNLGLMYLNSNRADFARSEFERALNLDPNNEPLREQLRGMR